MNTIFISGVLDYSLIWLFRGVKRFDNGGKEDKTV